MSAPTATIMDACDALAAALTAASSAWGWTGAVVATSQVQPTFELVRSDGALEITISPIPDSPKLERLARDSWQVDECLTVIVKAKVDAVNDVPNDTTLRLLLGIAQQVQQLVLSTSETSYQRALISPQLSARYDLDRLKQGMFLTSMRLNFRWGWSAT